MKLRDAIKEEWTTKNRDGVDSKTIAVKVRNGSVQYAMARAARDALGDDIFAKA